MKELTLAEHELALFEYNEMRLEEEEIERDRIMAEYALLSKGMNYEERELLLDHYHEYEGDVCVVDRSDWESKRTTY